jgi:hypothetical protein
MEWRCSSSTVDLGIRWKWVASFTSRQFQSRRKKPRYILGRRVCVPRFGLDAVVYRFLFPCRESNPSRPARIRRYSDWAIPAHILKVVWLSSKQRTYSRRTTTIGNVVSGFVYVGMWPGSIRMFQEYFSAIEAVQKIQPNSHLMSKNDFRLQFSYFIHSYLLLLPLGHRASVKSFISLQFLNLIDLGTWSSKSQGHWPTGDNTNRK